MTPNMLVRGKLNRLALEMVGDISWPEHCAIFSTPFNVAEQTQHSLIFYGENPQTEYGGPEGADEAMQMTMRWRSEFGGFLGLRPSDFVGMEGITERDMEDYTINDPGRNVEAYFLGQFCAWDSHENWSVAEQMGMQTLGDPPSRANWWHHENLDNAQTGVHDYFMFLKYGFGRGCQQISVDVRTGRVSREAALAWVEKHDGLFPIEYAGVRIDDVLYRIGMRPDQLQACVDRFRSV